MARIQYIPNRVIDENGISDGAQVFVYQSGTTTKVPLFSDAGLAVAILNPVVVPAGAEIPIFYTSYSGATRLRVVQSDGVISQDEDPYYGPASTVDVDEVRTDLASSDPGKGAELVGFKQVGPGSVDRTSLDKLREIVSIKDFGAIGDGATNDAAALISSPSGALAPDGDYYVNASVNKELEFMPGAEFSGPYANTVYPQGLRSQNSNYFLATFTSNVSLTNRPLTIHASPDGSIFEQIGYVDKDASGVSWNFGDASLFYHNGMWYAPFTDHATGDHDFCVARSRNLNDWEVVKCRLGTGVCVANGTAPGWAYVFTTGPRVWAPKLFKDASGNIYVSVSIQAQADQPAVDSASTFFFRQFYASCTSIDNLTFSVPTELQIDGKKGPGTAAAATENRIDGDIITRPDGTFAMAIKNEYGRYVNLCTSGTLAGNWTTTATNIAPLNGAGVPYTEGPSLTPVYRNGSLVYRVYVDKYDDSSQYYVETSDFIAITSALPVQADCMIRHGRVVNLGYLPRVDLDQATKTLQRSQEFFSRPLRSGIKRIVNFKNVPGFPTIANFAPQNGALYRMYYDGTNFDAVISSFAPVGQVPEGSYFYLALYAANGVLNQIPIRIRTGARVVASLTNGSPTMTVTGVGYGVLSIGMPVGGAGIQDGTVISAFGTGTGGNGTYTLSKNATSTNSGVTITGFTTNFLPNSLPFIIGQHLGTADTLFKFVLTENAWRMECVGPTDIFAGKLSGKIQMLSQVGNFPNINNGNTNFWPMAGGIYATDGSGTYSSTTTIWSLPTEAYPDGTRVGFSVYSGSANGTIVLKSGAHARWPADITINSADDSKVIEIMMIGGRWSLVR